MPGDDRPPIGRSWGWLYSIVAGSLLIWILLFYAFGRAFR